MNFIIHRWEDIAVLAACFAMVYALPFRAMRHAMKKVQSTEEREQHDH